MSQKESQNDESDHKGYTSPINLGAFQKPYEVYEGYPNRQNDQGNHDKP